VDDTGLGVRAILRAIGGLALLTFAAPLPTMAGEMNSHEGDPAAIARGSDLFALRCSFCHGGHGRGAKGPPLTAGHYKHGGSDLVLFSTIVGGRPGTQMGAFGTTLSTDEIWDIIAYLRDETRRRIEAGDTD
jgi:mono/diheme cytochrome c family protein